MFKNLFTNWRKVAEKAAARADALESEKRAVEHKNDHLRTERVMLRDQLDRVKMERDDRAEERDEWRDDYERQRDRGDELQRRLDAVAALETPHANATVRKMARIARGEGVLPAKVDAGPVPPSTHAPWRLLEMLEQYRDGRSREDLPFMFLWRDSEQGHKYWQERADKPYAELDDEARAIIDAWIADLEVKVGP